MSDKTNTTEFNSQTSNIEIVPGSSRGRDSETQQKFQQIRENIEEEQKLKEKRDQGILLTQEEAAKLRAVETQRVGEKEQNVSQENILGGVDEAQPKNQIEEKADVSEQQNSSIEVVSAPSKGRDPQTQQQLQQIRENVEEEQKIRQKRDQGILLTREEAAKLRAIEMQQEENRRKQQAEQDTKIDEEKEIDETLQEDSISERVKRDAEETEKLFAKQIGKDISTVEEEKQEVEVTPEEISQKDKIDQAEEEDKFITDSEISEEEAEKISNERGWDWANETQEREQTEEEEGEAQSKEEEKPKQEETTKEEKMETEIEQKRAERKRKIFKIISKVAGVGGAVLGAKGGYVAAGAITAAYGPIGLAGVVVAGGILFIKRRNIGEKLGTQTNALWNRMLGKTIQELENEIEEEKDRRLENEKIRKELLTSFFTGVSGGGGAGLVFGGFSNLTGVVNDVYPSETPSDATGIEETPSVDEIPEETIPAETEPQANFGELESSAHMVEQLNLNPDVVNQAIREGRLLGENLLLEGGTIAEPQGMFVNIVNHADLANIDLSTPENTKTFLEGIYEINRQVLSGNQVGEELVKDIASKTIENFQQTTN